MDVDGPISQQHSDTQLMHSKSVSFFRSHILSVLSEACKKQMAFNSTGWYDAVKRIAPLCRVELGPLLPLATEVVVELEKRRGVENDPTLRFVEN